MKARSFSLTVGIAVVVALALVAGSAAALSPARPLQQGGAPQVVGYQGRLSVSGAPYDGAGHFKFAVVNGIGNVTYWSNDGTSSHGSEPMQAVELAADDGLFSVLLGDAALANMTALPASAFSGTDRYLRVWFSSDGSTFTLLSPDRRFAATPYALQAEVAKEAGTLDGLDSAGFWQTGGNSATDPASDYLGTSDYEALELRVNGMRALRIEPAEVASLVGGSSANSVMPGAQGATIAGGGDGGHPNRVTDYHGAVGGGAGNTAGNGNASANDASHAAVAGGYLNTAGAYAAAVGGGEQNGASGSGAVVGGGSFNSAGGNRATVPGGALNRADGSWSFAAGYRAKSDHDGTFVWADSTYADFGSTAKDQFLVRASGGVSFTTGSAPFQVNGRDVQLRVAGVCTVGSTVRAINADGTVLCDPGDPLHRSAAPQTNTTTAVDTWGDFGYDNSVTIGGDGLPVISYCDAQEADLRVLHCGNAACTDGNTATTVDSAGRVGYNTSIAIGPDGLPVVSYYDDTNGDLKVLHCGNPACTGGNTASTVDSTVNVGRFTSIAIGADGLPVVSYYDDTNADLKVVHCGDAACTSSNTITAVDTDGDFGIHSSITIGVDGLPIISYFDSGNQDLKVAHCGNAACNDGNVITTVEWLGYVGQFTSIAVGADGLPVISYYHQDYSELKVAHCGNTACSSGNTVTAVESEGEVGLWSSITIGADGLPVITYWDFTNRDLKVLHCGDAACTGGNSITTVDAGGDVGHGTSVTIGTDGLPLASYRDDTHADLKVLHCSNALCVPYWRRR